MELTRASIQVMLEKGPPVKLLPVTTRGVKSGCPHTFLVRLTVAPEQRSMQYLDSCTTNAEINAEREEALGKLRSLLSLCDRHWSGVDWSEFSGWAGGVPQQLNSADCLLLSWWNATRLARGAADSGVLPEQLRLRGEAAQLLLLKILRSPLLRSGEAGEERRG